MTAEESTSRFAAAKVAGKRTGCAPLRGMTTKTWTLKDLESMLVHDGVPVALCRNGDGYELSRREANGVVYRTIKKVAATR